MSSISILVNASNVFSGIKTIDLFSFFFSCRNEKSLEIERFVRNSQRSQSLLIKAIEFVYRDSLSKNLIIFYRLTLVWQVSSDSSATFLISYYYWHFEFKFIAIFSKMYLFQIVLINEINSMNIIPKCGD